MTAYVVQLSGVTFFVLPFYILYSKGRICTTRIDLHAIEFVYTPSQQCADIGLGLSSLLYWNYVMFHGTPGVHYGIVYGFDSVMIGTNAIVSTWPGPWFRTPLAFVHVASALALHYIRSNGISAPTTFRGHVYLCMLSVCACIWKRVQCPSSMNKTLWSIRLSTSVACTVVYYGCLRKLKSVQSFRRLPWWLPWMWHTVSAASAISNRAWMIGAD